MCVFQSVPFVGQEADNWSRTAGVVEHVHKLMWEPDTPKIGSLLPGAVPEVSKPVGYAEWASAFSSHGGLPRGFVGWRRVSVSPVM